uniref:Ribosomal large subunit pseudouridine synthase C pu n=1 Tax=Albugo laibachii Nc14 TaxID=890382 RepID=F0WE21_9STRA|nr:ribosomal large subunit pseudouridine synthase C pu [Albugo laibachii Nc14]|eukprot:CCA19450.1 ribosomal large subunit pseudouridine synthase C pu [Albugo laibachii Nc14]
MSSKWVQSGRHWLARLLSPNDHNIRLDRWLSQEFGDKSNSFIQKHIRKGNIRLSVSQTKHERVRRAPANQKLQSGNLVAIRKNTFHEFSQKTNEFLPLEPFISSEKRYFEALYERIRYRDANYFILDKPSGLAVQGGERSTKSLADYFHMFHERLSKTDDPEMDYEILPELPRLVHRIDKGTSGLVVIARHRRAAAAFSELLRERRIEKEYQAFVIPSRTFEVPETGRLESVIEGKEAITMYKVIDPVSREITLAKLSFEFPQGKCLKVWPITGRKHQIRIHCATILHAPILGDGRYGCRESNALDLLPNRMYLHAAKISFPNPFFYSAQTPRTIEIECPLDIA